MVKLLTSRHAIDYLDPNVLCYAGQKSLIPSQKGVGKRRGRSLITLAMLNAASSLAAHLHLTQTQTLRTKCLAESFPLLHRCQLPNRLIADIICHQARRSCQSSSVRYIVIQLTVVKKKMAGKVYKYVFVMQKALHFSLVK